MPTEIDVLLKEIKDVQGFVQGKIADGVKPLREELERVSKVLTENQTRLQELQRSLAAKAGQDGRVIVPSGRLAGYSLLDLRLMENLLRHTRHGEENGLADSPLYKGIIEARQGVRSYLRPESLLAWEDSCLRERMAAFRGELPMAARRQFRESVSAWTRDLVPMVTRALDSTTTAKGDELVPTFEAAELWMDVNLATLVLPLFMQQPMPTNPFDIPLQFGNMNWYPGTENVQATTTDPTTAKTTLTAYQLKAGVPFSDELEEDSIVALVPALRAQLVLNAAQTIDDVLLNGDTATLNNINADGTTISKTTAGKAHWLLGFKGLIILPLTDNTAQRKDQNAALTASMFNQGQRRLGKYGVPMQRGDVVFIADVNTALTALTLAQVETMEKLGVRATISTGELASIYGNPLVMSQQMKLADTDGKVTDAGNATNTGRILTVNTTQWRVGFRRQIEIETQREAGKSQTTMYISFRVAFTERTGTRTTATHSAIEFDITGVA